jgi:Sulfatase
MLDKIRNCVVKFINDKKEYPVIAAIFSGLYPLLYYYNSNFTSVNSWSQFSFFIISFLLVPITIFYLLFFLFKQINGLKKYSKYVVAILNYTWFTFLVILITNGFENKILILLLFVAVVLGILLFKHVNKIILVQCLMAMIIFPKLIPDLYKYFAYSNVWMEQPDAIEQVVFKRRPNIYMIQPDGYANFLEIKKGYYNFDNKSFEKFLVSNNFKLYQDIRSNYNSTLSSNSSMFAMKHHYLGDNEFYNSRAIIAGDNPVISIFKKNNYKTFLMLEKSYLLINRPKIKYDFCNIEFNEISFLDRGFEIDKDLIQDLKKTIQNNVDTNNFYFIEKLKPNHITNLKHASQGKEVERNNYLKNVKEANIWLKDVINLILKEDNNCLIVIAADHGGYVGMNSSSEGDRKQTDRDIIYSIFTTALAIKWTDEVPLFDDKLKTNVNLFRILFSYLSKNEIYLKHLQDDKSFMLINKGAPKGVYEYIDVNNNIIFKKFSN